VRFPDVSKLTINLLALLLVAVVGILDYTTGYEISFSVFYLIPIMISTWLTDFRSAAVVSALSSVIWLTADLLWEQSFSHPFIPYWNAFTRLLIFLVISYALTRLHRELRREKQLARTDSVTRIANGRYFIELARLEIQKLKRYGHPFTLAYLDVDNFKTVNDTMGHDAGDDLLRLIADTLQKTTRGSDTVARLGGDEFGMLLPETGADKARPGVVKIRLRLTSEIKARGFPVTFSIGAVTFDAAPESVDEAIKMTDDVMYSAKRAGKDRVEYKRYVARKELVTTGEKTT
jgi:diguanylate cyclase (GGDEF)-like protein